MPQAVIAFAFAIVGALEVIGFSFYAAVAILNVGVQLAGLALLGAIARKLIDIPDLQQTAKSNLVTVRGTLEHQRIIYGETLVSGPIWYMNIAGAQNRNMYHGVVVAGHEIEDITDVWLDDEIISEAAIDWAGDGSVDSGLLRGDTSLVTTAYFKKFLGDPGQTASPELIATFAEVNSSHIGA